MKVGTKSVLFGAHCFFIHPLFVALAWWKLFGFPRDMRLWIAFFLHDLGYWGCPNMDGTEGERHPIWAARVMHKLFDGMESWWYSYKFYDAWRWWKFCAYHSRFLAKKDGQHFSKLCVADKYSLVLIPWWLYVPMVTLTGEIREYMKLAEKKEGKKYSAMDIKTTLGKRKWFESMTKYLNEWVQEHKDMRPDTWTPDTREARDESGV